MTNGGAAAQASGGAAAGWLPGITLIATSERMPEALWETKEQQQVNQIVAEVHGTKLDPATKALAGGPAAVYHHDFPAKLVEKNKGWVDTVTPFIVPWVYFLSSFIKAYLWGDTKKDPLAEWMKQNSAVFYDLSTLAWIREQKSYLEKDKKDDDIEERYKLLQKAEESIVKKYLGEEEEKEEEEAPKLRFEELITYFAHGVKPEYLKEYEVEGLGKIEDKLDMFEEIYQRVQEKLEEEKERRCYSQPQTQRQYLQYGVVPQLPSSTKVDLKEVIEFVKSVEEIDDDTTELAIRLLDASSKYMSTVALEKYSNFGKYLAEAYSKIYKE